MAKEVKTKEVRDEYKDTSLFGTEGLMNGKGREGGNLILEVKGQRSRVKAGEGK